MTGELAKQEMAGAPTASASCYIASKVIHARKIVALRDAWPRVYFTARWPIIANISSESVRPAPHWLMDNVDDIIRADSTVVYAEEGDVLKGAIWEAGVAWAHGKEIWLIGDNESYSKWKFAPRVRRVPKLEDALSAITERTLYRANDANRIIDAIREVDERIKAVEKIVGKGA